jgi:hypothetical protein
MYLGSSAKIPHFVLFHQKNMATLGNSCIWLAETLKVFSAETANTKLLVGIHNVCEVLHSSPLFCMDPGKYMVAMDNSCFWLIQVKKKLTPESTSNIPFDFKVGTNDVPSSSIEFLHVYLDLAKTETACSKLFISWFK